MANLPRFRTFIQSFTRLVESVGGDEPRILAEGRKLLADLIAHDDWLPDAFAEPDPERYRQNLLYCDPLERFSVVSFVWGPGQATPVHDHTVWGMVGVMRGAETCEEFESEPGTGRVRSSGTHRLDRGGIDLVSPRIGDIHRVSNALSDRASVSIHVYGGNIGAIRRHVFELASGASRPFVSGYSNAVIPNLWDRSKEAAAAG
jgi:predicted metal-dependent enzyme (double-stranded beta helix superfamily)